MVSVSSFVNGDNNNINNHHIVGFVARIRNDVARYPAQHRRGTEPMEVILKRRTGVAGSVVEWLLFPAPALPV